MRFAAVLFSVGVVGYLAWLLYKGWQEYKRKND